MTKNGQVDAEGDGGRTILIWAIFCQMFAFAQDLCKKLNKINVDIDAKNKDGKTVLHYAAKNENTEIVKLLNPEGAEIHVRNEVETTPLFIAAFDDHIATIEFLLKSGNDVNAKNILKPTYLHIAA